MKGIRVKDGFYRIVKLVVSLTILLNLGAKGCSLHPLKN
jgi:hypothetical protein